MKKYCLLILTLICFAVMPCFADTHTATKNGCWADSTVWDVSAVPGDGDDVALAGYTVTAIGNGTTDCTASPSARIPATGTLGTVTSTATAGLIEVKLDDDDCHGGCGFYATSLTGGTKANGMLAITGTTDHAMTVDITNIYGGATTSFSYGLYWTATGTLTLNANCNGPAAGTSQAGCYLGAGTVNMTGNAIGTTAPGVFTGASPVLTLTGDITGGTTGYGLALGNSSGAITLHCTTITGGSGYTAGIGAAITGSSSVTIDNTCNMVSGTGGVPYYGKVPSWSPASSGYMKWGDTYFPPALSAENVKSGVVTGVVTGTYGGSGGTYAY